MCKLKLQVAFVALCLVTPSPRAVPCIIYTTTNSCAAAATSLNKIDLLITGLIINAVGERPLDRPKHVVKCQGTKMVSAEKVASVDIKVEKVFKFRFRL